MAYRLSKWLLYSLAWTPLLVWKGLYYQFSTTEAFFVMAVVELLILLFVWAAYRDPQLRPRLGIVGMAFLTFVAMMVLASVFGVDPLLSFWSKFDRLTGVVFWLHLSAILVIAPSLLTTKQDWQTLFLCSTFVGLLVTTFHLLAFTSLDGTWLIHRSGTIGNSTFFGAYLLFQVIVCALLFVRGSGFIRLLAMGLGLVFILGLATSEAQAVLLSTFGGLLFALALAAVAKGKRFVRGAGVVMITVLAGFFILSLFRLADPESSIRETFIDYSSGSRFALWDIAWQGIKEKSLFGWGPENFQYVFQEHYNPCFGSSTCGAQNLYDRAHNKVLDVLVETGFVGTLAYMGIFVAVLWVLWRRCEKAERNTSIILTAGFASYFVQNLVSLDVPVTLVFWTFLLAYVASFESVLPPRKRQFYPQAMVSMWTLVMPFIFFFVIVQPLRANVSIGEWFLAESVDDRLAALDRATGLSWVGLDDRRAYMARQGAGGVWVVKIRGETQRPTVQTELAMIRTRLEESLVRTPQALPLVLNLALVIQTQISFFGMPEDETPALLLEQGIKNHPYFPQTYWALAAAYLERGKVEGAVEATEAALVLDPTVFESSYQHLIALKFTNDQARLNEATKETLSRFPEHESEIQLVYEADVTMKRLQLLFELY